LQSADVGAGAGVAAGADGGGVVVNEKLEHLFALGKMLEQATEEIDQAGYIAATPMILGVPRELYDQINGVENPDKGPETWLKTYDGVIYVTQEEPA
jgi:hypothetical protein